ncbi:MAG: acyltransferase [Microcoleus vaginatus WJT46-NPBG5]|nr:acyltransferase [Microcoleus vaginatus WJT46-NPBG5]
MNKPLYFQKLDALRGVASLYVLFHNLVYGLVGLKLVSPKVKIFFAAGQEAVILFFLLSGFVIYLSFYKNPNINFSKFFIKRFRRIYFILLISLIISIFVSAFNGNLAQRFSEKELIGNLLFLQDFGRVKPGNLVNPFLGNLPLWSLSYEWWFYMMFFLAYTVLPKSKNRIYFVLTYSAICYMIFIIHPNHFCLISAYFIIWWSGVEAATIFTTYNRFTYNHLQPIFISLILMSLLAALPLQGAEELRFGYYPFLVLRHFFTALLLMFIGWIWYKNKLFMFDKLLGVFAKISPISYALYIFHYPILVQWHLRPYIPNYWLEYSLKIVVLLGLAYLTEIKLQSRIYRWIK